MPPKLRRFTTRDGREYLVWASKLQIAGPEGLQVVCQVYFAADAGKELRVIELASAVALAEFDDEGLEGLLARAERENYAERLVGRLEAELRGRRDEGRNLAGNHPALRQKRGNSV